ncbi:MAG TPA: DNA-binding protein [Alloiococcus sp.]|nr:DNA-binding protein [Alloiococcus sp.]
MNKHLTKVITAIVIDQQDGKSYAQKEGMTYSVRTDEDLSLGDTVSGFAYVNQSNNLTITTDIPSITNEKYGWAEVVNVRRDLGVFVSIGLPDKDIAVSMDELPLERHQWPKTGDRLLIKLSVDKKDRIWGNLAEQDYFRTLTNKGSKAQHNNNVTGYVVEIKSAGEYVITADNFLAYIPEVERDEELRLGEAVAGRVTGVREDGVLYISLHPRAHEVMDEDAKMIYAAILRSTDKAIPYHDKSDPQAIRDYFGISKGQFKRAVGRLMKEGLVNQDGEQTYAIEK